MNQQLELRVKTAFGLAFDIEKDPTRESGFRPAETDLGAGLALFGDIRLDGFAKALELGFAENLVVIGGDEGRYKAETPIINRAETIRQMLIQDYGIKPYRVTAIPSRSNTGGNIAIIKSVMATRLLPASECALITNLYHLPRAHMDLVANDLHLPLFAAEAFMVLAGEDEKMLNSFGTGPLASRYAAEVAGIAAKIRGNYKPLTDNAAKGRE